MAGKCFLNPDALLDVPVLSGTDEDLDSLNLQKLDFKNHEEEGSKNHVEEDSKNHEERDSKNHEEKDSKNNEEKDSKNHEEDSKNHEENDSKNHEEKDSKNREEKDSKNHEEQVSKNHKEKESKIHQKVELKKKAKPEIEESIMEARVRKLAESLRQGQSDQASWISPEENMVDFLEAEVDMDIEYLKKAFPDISEQSLKDVYFINCGDLEDTIDMLSQLEGNNDIESPPEIPDIEDLPELAPAVDSTSPKQKHPKK